MQILGEAISNEKEKYGVQILNLPSHTQLVSLLFFISQGSFEKRVHHLHA